jgi:NAD(P)-dependent dehydrogenase (short-subunit alcohol dehydrogenase family)
MNQTLKDKVAVVTGAGSGMGLTVASLLHSMGATLVLTDISGKEADAAKGLGDRAVARQGDVGNAADMKAVADLAVSTFGGVDILCNVAGARLSMDLLADESPEDFDREYAINARGPFLTMKYCIPHMVARGGGSIINVASSAGIRAWKNMAGYSAGKAALIALTRVAALEYGDKGVRANVVSPGTIDTPMLREWHAKTPGRREYVLTLNPLHRLGQMDEIANTIAFLASDAASYISGVVLPVDGGQTI